jgi:pimeloyl-ACP methyl ester carboxylesterase
VVVATVAIEGWPVEYEIAGDGDPVVFTHASPFVSWYRPLLDAVDGWTTLVYRRSATFRPGLCIEDDADLLAGLADHVGIERPHLVGHSYGGLVALSAAARGRPDVTSLALLEPATMGLLEPSQARQRSAPLFELAGRQGAAAAMEGFLQAVCGTAGRALLDQAVPGATAASAPGMANRKRN